MNEQAQENGMSAAFADAEVGDAGLTKREYIAAFALQGLCANPGAGGFPMASDATRLADFAVQFADVLLERLERE